MRHYCPSARLVNSLFHYTLGLKTVYGRGARLMDILAAKAWNPRFSPSAEKRHYYRAYFDAGGQNTLSLTEFAQDGCVR